MTASGMSSLAVRLTITARGVSQAVQLPLVVEQIGEGTGSELGKDRTEIDLSKFLDRWEAYRCQPALLPLQKPWFRVRRKFAEVEAGVW